MIHQKSPGGYALWKEGVGEPSKRFPVSEISERSERKKPRVSWERCRLQEAARKQCIPSIFKSISIFPYFTLRSIGGVYRLKSSELVTTETELNAMANPAISGRNVNPDGR